MQGTVRSSTHIASLTSLIWNLPIRAHDGRGRLMWSSHANATFVNRAGLVRTICLLNRMRWFLSFSSKFFSDSKLYGGTAFGYWESLGFVTLQHVRLSFRTLTHCFGNHWCRHNRTVYVRDILYYFYSYFLTATVKLSDLRFVTLDWGSWEVSLKSGSEFVYRFLHFLNVCQEMEA